MILITGGAGYIGSHVLKQLLEYTDNSIMIVDNLSTGNKKTFETLKEIRNFTFVKLDLNEFEKVNELIKDNDIDTIIHFAASIVVPELVENPLNYGTGIKNKVLEAMSYGIPSIGFKEAFTNLDLINNETCLIVSDLNQLALECSNKSLSDISKLLYKKSNKDFSFSKIKNLVFQEIYGVVNE